MEFKVFAKKLKNVIGGKSNTKIFTKTIFETMMNESGPELLADTSQDTFKAYFNGNTSISKVAALILANLSDDDEFPSYLEGFGDTTAQLLADEFKNDIPDINSVNASLKITELFLEILKEAVGKEKSTPKSADKTPHDVLEEKILASGQAVAVAWGNAVSNLVNGLDGNRNAGTTSVQLGISESNDFGSDNHFEIPKDSYIYLKQLLKTSCAVDGNTVRPLIVLLYLLSKLGELSSDEFTYLLPL